MSSASPPSHNGPSRLLKRSVKAALIRISKAFPGSSAAIGEALAAHAGETAAKAAKAARAALRAEKAALRAEKAELRAEKAELRAEKKRQQKQFSAAIDELASGHDPILHADLFVALYAHGLINSTHAHRWLQSLFRARRIETFAAICDRPLPRLEPLIIYHRCRLADFRGRYHLSDLEMTHLLDDTAGDHLLRKPVINLAAQQFSKTENVSALTPILSSSDALGLLSHSSCLGAIRLLLKQGYRDEAFRVTTEYVNLADRKHIALYFLEIIQRMPEAYQVKIDIPSFRDWRAILEYFSAHLCPREDSLAEEFMKYFVEPFDVVGRDQDYMDARSNTSTRAALQELILRKLTAKRPLSLLRLGDGEAYAFDAPDVLSATPDDFAFDNATRETYWWGSSPDEKTRQEIKTECRKSFSEADILGIPSVYRLIRDLGSCEIAIGSHRSTRGLMVVMHAIRSAMGKRLRAYTEERIHHVALDPDYLRSLSARADRTVVVGCWSADDLPDHGLTNAKFLHVSPQSRVRDDSDTTPPLYLNYREIIDRVEALSAPGVLVLVAAGLIGKIFVHRARAKGAVALDIGSVADYMAGRKTRSVADIV